MGIMDGLGQGAGRARDIGIAGAQKGWGAAKSVSGGAKTVAVGGAGLMAGLAAGGFGTAKKAGGATLFVILGFLLFLFDVVSDYRGFYITNVDPMGFLQAIWSFGYVVFVFMVFIYLVSQDRSPGVLASWAALLIVVMITLGLIFRFNPIAITHLVYILLLWFFFVRGNEGTIRSNKLLIIFLLVDLYAFSILNWLSSFGLFSSRVAEVFVGFPFLFIATNVYVWEKTHNALSITFLTFSIIWYGLMGGPQIAKNLGLAGFAGEIEDLPFSTWGEFWKIGKQEWIDAPTEKVTTAVKDWVSGQIEYAITGKVEENEYEPLGVYLEKVQSSDPKYYEGEDVIVWGTVRARTLDEPIYIKVGCYAEDMSKKEGEEGRKIDGIIEPAEKFPVFTLEEKDFLCNFEGGKGIKTGSSSVKTFAEFNFETLAYLKTYFINKERQIAMMREGLDVFEEFDIKDKNPTAVYTNGPVELAIETTSPLIGVSDEYTVHPSLDISLVNREGWEGEILDLKELVLFFPEGITLDDCNLKIGVNNYTPENCQGNCTKIKEECDGICSSFGGCGDSCEESKKKCDDTCNLLLVQGNYLGYSLNLESLRDGGVKNDPEKFKFFRCRFKPDPSKVLEGSAPIATKYFRVKARYNYSIEKAVTVKVEDGWVEPPKILEVKVEGTSIIINWTKSADDGDGPDDVTGYKIYRRKDGELEFKESIKTMPKGSEDYKDESGLVAGAMYYYKVVAIDDGGNTGSSGEMGTMYTPPSE